MERKLILRGLLSGAIAGVLAFVFAKLFAEPQIDRAIAYEAGRDAAQQALDRAAGLTVAEAGPDPFSRATQSGVGIGVGLVAFGIALGGIYAVAYAIMYNRVGAVRARTLALLVALGGLLTIYLVPFVKYPANPPAIGHEESLSQRTALYLTMVAASVVLGGLAVWTGRRLRSRFSAWTATLLAGAGFLVVIGILMALLPSLGELASNRANYGNFATETPQPLLDPAGKLVYPGFPADVLFYFRFASVGTQLVLWGALGLAFAPLAERLLEPERRGAGRSGQSAQVPAASPTR